MNQKIDNIKNQLTALVDLVEPSASGQTSGPQLDAKEAEVLRAAGLLAGPSKGRPRPKHVVFVDNEEQGTSDDGDCSKNVTIRICVTARQYAARQKAPSSNESDPVPEDDADLGWISRRRKSQQKTLSETSQVSLQPDVVAVRSIILIKRLSSHT